MDQTIQKQLPEWTLEDAYGTVQDKRFQDELQKIHCEIKKLRDLLPTNPTKENVSRIQQKKMYCNVFRFTKMLLRGLVR